ncbi:alpha/beta fold hydrolase [Bradyrhizobium sp. ma5]|uniref:alpha/beta fold hydrolase n=1 Tax=Bradyrhizobium sp. ma5 TaxID=3344828 RepID=UPI0035D47534
MGGYVTFGNGPKKVIALHGWFGDHTTFDAMRNALTPGAFTYALPAYRGYGLSKAITGEYSIREISADVIEIADKLGWPHFDLIGHSMGGMAVQRVLADAPERVRKIVAITPVPASGVPLPPDQELLFAGAANSPEARHAIIDFSTSNRQSRSWIDHMVSHSFECSTTEAFAAYFQAWSKTNFVDAIIGNKVPMLVIVGANDPSLNADMMKATYLNWYPNAILEVIENAGHYPMDETPVALATRIEKFLS